jgi:carbon storage regulator CsrA
MLVLTRKVQQRIRIGREITVTILRIRGRAVKIGIEAPAGLEVLRDELTSRKMTVPVGEKLLTSSLPPRG